MWFGTPSEDGTWLMFDDDAKLRFYDAWKETYELIRSIDPGAIIGGPGYCDYDIYEITHFLQFCKENNCLPNIMIYHELSDKSALYWEDHVEEYRQKETELGINKLPIIVTEYGTMAECGAPADMLKYIVGIEKSGTWANAAYWRLANNLCDTAADNNSPNSNWWLFRWYADMEGNLLSSKVVDVFHADFANVFKYGFNRFHYDEFNGLASINSSKDEITILCSGSDYSSQVALKNLNKTNLGKNVNIKIESVYYEGLSGIVNSPTIVKEYTDRSILGKLNINLKNPDPTAVYKITITSAQDKKNYTNSNLPIRYEFEHGTLLGNSYAYDSAYATTGEVNGMVGGIENDGDGVSLDFKVKEDGYYDLSLIFGNSNDGSTPDERTYSTGILNIDGEAEILSFPNTIKSEYTDKIAIVKHLKKGNHTITLTHNQGTYVLDSMIVKQHEKKEEITLLPDTDRTNENMKSFLAIAPDDGFYSMTTEKEVSFTVDGANGYCNNSCIIYLRKGLNYIDFDSDEEVNCRVKVTEQRGFSQKVKANEMILTSPAVLQDDYIDGISSLGGNAEFTVTVPKNGSYRMTLAYANNDEGGVHSYNVDLIERYITITVNGETHKLWCRNTYSWDTVKTATLNLELKEGENTIILSNDGSTTFNSTPSHAPHIYWVTVNKTSE